jgi:hypothetical protein
MDELELSHDFGSAQIDMNLVQTCELFISLLKSPRHQN